MAINSEIVIAWQVAHTVLLVAVLVYLLRVSSKLRELRNARGEAQMWLNEFARLINASTSAVKDMRVSIAAAQDELPKVLAGVEAIKKNLAAPRPPGTTEPASDHAANAKQHIPHSGGEAVGIADYENAYRTRQQPVRPPTAPRGGQVAGDRSQSGVSPLAGLK